MLQDQGDDLGNTEDQPNVEEASKHDWFKKLERPPTPDRDWYANKQIDLRPPQTWISKMAKAGKPPTTFDELMSTPIDFSAYVLHNLKIKNLTQEHLGPKCQSFYGYASNRKSKHDVFSTKRIIAVTHVKVVKKYDYGYLEEIIVRREDQSLHKFVEGDFPRLNLHDIEDMLLPLVQKKLFNLERDDLFDLNLALRMPETFRLMRFGELYKFCDGTLLSVRRVLYDIASILEMDYLPKRRWSKLDRKRCRIMIKAIDQQFFERRVMRNLDKFVGGREYGNDFRPNQGKKTKRRRTKESKSSKKPSTTKETPKGKAPSKGSKTGNSALVKEPVENLLLSLNMKLCEGTLEGVGGKQNLKGQAIGCGWESAKQALQEAIISSVKFPQFLYLRKHTPIKKVLNAAEARHILVDSNIALSKGDRVPGSRVAYRMLPG
ncbi:hypothetical protein Tco_0222870 [Tanacetum coccineum]